MAKAFSMDDYVDVAERIQDLMDAHPKGSLQRVGEPHVMEIGSQKFIVYTAAAYRTPDDPRPGIGTAWEPFPGRTPYTKDSELMNAETAAWGRAIVALGLVANRKLASRQEVRNRVADQEADAATAPSKPKTKAKAKPAKTETPAEPVTPSNEAVAAMCALYLKSKWEEEGQDDTHSTLRLQLAAVNADNSGTPEECFKRLTKAQFEATWTALSDTGEELTP